MSVGLGMHGPNIGVSGGPEALSEGLLAAFSWLHGQGAHACERVWLIVTGWDDEPALDTDATPYTDPICRAVAVGLTRASAAGDGLLLRMAATNNDSADRQPAPVNPLLAFGEALAARRRAAEVVRWSHRCPWGMAVRLETAAAHAGREAA
mgnify:FL=1